MGRFLWCVVTCATVLVTSCRGLGSDSTVTPGAFGTDVVLAVINSLQSNCILSSDRLFLRRLAYVETRDGTDSATYRAGYDGGIWKIDRDMFTATSTCSSSYIRATCDLIKQELGIDWTHVQWSDLRKPLYSGLAAALYTLLKTQGNENNIPAEVSQQASFWSQNFHHGGTSSSANFTQLVADTTLFDCKKEMDMAFILDASGSINPLDYQLSLNFTARVAAAMDVPNTIKVATIVFDSTASIHFDFNDYSTKAQVLSAIRSTPKPGGGTSTYLALDLARTTLFTPARGATSNRRVAVLITDGRSNFALTSQAATLLKGAGVTVFAIGVGGYNLLELKEVASEPKCTHVFTLQDFSQIDSILYQIQTSTCNAHTAVTPNFTITATNQTEIKLTIQGHTTSLNSTSSTSKPPEIIPVVNVTCGIAEIYVSDTNPNPSPALYTDKFTATDGSPAYLVTEATRNGRPVYVTVVGSHLPPQAAQLTNWEQLRQEPGIRQTVCTNYYEQFPNPCTPYAIGHGKVIFQYPYDQNRFIRCDYHGNPYVTLCPNRQTFNPATLTCGYASPGSTDRVPLPSSYPNPCTPEHIQAQFIHCDLFGDAWLQSCPSLEVWDQIQQTCVADRPTAQPATTRSHSTLVNPCTSEAEAAGKQFFPYPCDHTRFIHCGVAGAYWVQFCPGGMYFDPATYICVLGDPQHTPGCD
ncbi:hypothetical protein BaRGS_00020718 [Batillaria attramentaria]|uniref:Uncharacterized protein n=1 Tax=Batillaria attramentaria TaxID=370345 RepID=A0ABD0KL64_9CAEN